MDPYELLIAFLAQLGVISLFLTTCSLVRDRMKRKARYGSALVSGLFSGTTAAVLMTMPGELIDGFRFDLRIVPLAVVGLISGPVGAVVAAVVASAARLWLGGAGALLGSFGIWVGVAVACIGSWGFRRGLSSNADVVLFSGINSALALAVFFFLPTSVQGKVIEENAHLILLLLNFLGTLIATFFVRLDLFRRQSAELNELHKQIVSALPDALNVKDIRGRFLLANEATAKLMGAAGAAEMVGRTDFDFYQPEEAQRFWEQELAFMQGAQPQVLEQQFQRGEKTVFLSTIKVPFWDEFGELKGIVSHTSDITDQKTLQAELISTQVLLETAMAEMADGLAMFDGDGRLIMWNRRYLEFFPYVDEHTCYGSTLAELLTAGVFRGKIDIPLDASAADWVAAEVERSRTATQSDLRLTDGRWLSKSTRALHCGGWVTLYSDISDKKAIVAQLEQLASRDGLTGLANRRTFDRRLSDAFHSAEAAAPLSLLLIDVDHFKAYNDTYGHPAGDDVLRQLAGIFGSGCRGNRDLVARYGGEEFAVILPDAPFDAAMEVAIRLSENLRSLRIPHKFSSTGFVTVSIGVACTAESGADPAALLKICDEALYAAKAGGRDQVHGSDSRKRTSNRRNRQTV